MSGFVSGRPDPGEYLPYFGRYIDRVPGDDGLASIEGQIGDTLALLRGVSEADSLKRYAAGKWSLRELVGHVTDAERVFAYRAMRFARGDETPLPGFEQDPWIAQGNFDSRPWTDLLDELATVRRGSVLLLRGLDPAAWGRKGVASGGPLSVRALAFIIAGHELHHMNVVRTKYL
jgi:hypothetical protein